MRRHLVVGIGLIAGISVAAPADEGGGPFEFLEPSIQISNDDQQRLDQRDVVLRILPAGGHELAVMAAGSIDVGPDSFVLSVRNIEALKRGPLVPQIRRFSSTPRQEDLSELTLDAVDFETIRRCRPNRCALKLTPDEIGRLQHALAGSTASGRESVTEEFRRIVLDRAISYLRKGDGTTAEQFSILLQHAPFVSARAPGLARYLTTYPAAPIAGAESFLYWSKETYAWKPMITVTHLTILRGDVGRGWPEVLVVSRDIFATRYTSGSFILTMLFRDRDSASRRYLVYVNRTWVDGVRALWRPFVEHRIKGQARKVFAAVRERIEADGAKRHPSDSWPHR